MANVIKTGWFGRKVTVMLMNGKSTTGELTEVNDNYLVLEGENGNETVVMVHAIIAVKLASSESPGESGGLS